MVRPIKVPDDMQVGTIFQSRAHGSFRIIAYTGCEHVIIKSTTTSTILNVQAGHLRVGNVKDYLYPFRYGVGYMGLGKYSSKTHPVVYQAWANMLARCYDPEIHKKYPTYVGVTVCMEWHNFQTFAAWYELYHPNDGVIYQIDKDIYGSDTKIYSPNTCVFVVAQVNAEAACAKHYVFLSPEGERVDIYNLAKFCKDHGLQPSKMVAVNNFKRNHHKQWRRYE